MKQKQTIENHVWELPKKHELAQEEKEILMSGDYGPSVYVEVLQRLSVGEYLPIKVIASEMRLRGDTRDTRYLQDRIQALNRAGLNVGRGDAEYGFKMPLPENGQVDRELIIFRRIKIKK